MKEYVRRMSSSDWGDNLMVAMIARTFQVDITIVGTDSVRTYLCDGSEMGSPLDKAILLFHDKEFHYYGVMKSGAQEEVAVKARDTGGAPSAHAAVHHTLRGAVWSGSVAPEDAVGFLTDEQVLALDDMISSSPGSRQKRQVRDEGVWGW